MVDFMKYSTGGSGKILSHYATTNHVDFQKPKTTRGKTATHRPSTAFATHTSAYIPTPHDSEATTSEYRSSFKKAPEVDRMAPLPAISKTDNTGYSRNMVGDTPGEGVGRVAGSGATVGRGATSIGMRPPTSDPHALSRLKKKNVVDAESFGTGPKPFSTTSKVAQSETSNLVAPTVQDVLDAQATLRRAPGQNNLGGGFAANTSAFFSSQGGERPMTSHKADFCRPPTHSGADPLAPIATIHRGQFGAGAPQGLRYAARPNTASAPVHLPPGGDYRSQGVPEEPKHDWSTTSRVAFSGEQPGRKKGEVDPSHSGKVDPLVLDKAIAEHRRKNPISAAKGQLDTRPYAVPEGAPGDFHTTYKGSFKNPQRDYPREDLWPSNGVQATSFTAIPGGVLFPDVPPQSDVPTHPTLRKIYEHTHAAETTDPHMGKLRSMQSVQHVGSTWKPTSTGAYN